MAEMIVEQARMVPAERGALCSMRTVFAYSPSTGTSDESWAWCTRSVVCCSSHPSILMYCEVESMAKAAYPGRAATAWGVSERCAGRVAAGGQLEPPP